jgi:hypothetical protein
MPPGFCKLEYDFSPMPKNKTTKTGLSVTDFINSVENEQKRTDTLELVRIMKEISGMEPYMYGAAIIGFGSYNYTYESGHSGDAPLLGFSPRKNSLTLYLSSKFRDRDKLLSELGKHTISVACLYIKKLDDINIPVLKKMIRNSLDHSKQIYPDHSI